MTKRGPGTHAEGTKNKKNDNKEERPLRVDREKKGGHGRGKSVTRVRAGCGLCGCRGCGQRLAFGRPRCRLYCAEQREERAPQRFFYARYGRLLLLGIAFYDEFNERIKKKKNDRKQ